MRCCRFTTLFLFTFTIGWLSLSSLWAQSQTALFSSGEEHLYVNQFKNLPDGEKAEMSVVIESEACDNPYEAARHEMPGLFQFKFWQSIVVHSGMKQSRCVILKDLPFSGYYDVKVVAMYSREGGSYEDEEEYSFAVVWPDSTIVGEVIDDQNQPGMEPTGEVLDIKEKADKYLYVRNAHGLFYLQKGDNIIRFYAGNQFKEGGNINSVDFHSIELAPPPHIFPEPPFTAGHSNTIEWLGIDAGAVAQEVMYFDTSSSLAKIGANQSFGKQAATEYESTTFNGLVDGHTYGYFLEAYLDAGSIIRSDTTFSTQDASPPERVKIDSMLSMGNQTVQLFWNGVADIVSGVKEYQVVRSENNDMETVYVVIDTIAAGDRCQDGGPFEYCFIDLIDDPAAMNKEYKYRIDAVDHVGNKSSGIESKLVVGVPAPVLTTIPPAVADSFYQGAQITLQADLSMLALPESHKIIFQAVREKEEFFESRFQPGKYFFESPWLSLKKDTEDTTYTFDLTEGGASLQFVDGHRYLFRAQLQDMQGNLSLWSYDLDSLFVIPDCFPADDISFLDLQAITNGIDSFAVYRKVETADSFEFVAYTADEFYQDNFTSINFNGDVSYRIGSIDRVGWTRDASQTSFEATARSQSAPICRLIPKEDEIINGKYYTTSKYVLAVCQLDNFVDRDSLKIFSSMNEIEQEIRLVKNTSDLYQIILPDSAFGIYLIRIRALFKDKSASLWSKPYSIEYVAELPGNSNLLSEDNNRIKVTNYPNPFNLSTSITYILDDAADVSVKVYNVQGRRIRTLVDEHQSTGTHSVLWDGYNSEGKVVSSGIYYYRVLYTDKNGQKVSRIQKMLLVK